MIKVINKSSAPEIKGNYKIVNVMRPSVLSNIYSHNPNSAATYIVDSRKEAVELYKADFLKRVKIKGKFRDEVIRLYKLAQKHDLYLLCCCKPKMCHGDVIKAFLEEMLGDKIYMEELLGF